jgi:N-methylhydantoinase A
MIPSVTDADVVLGYLNPAALLGGSLPIDSAAAAEAIRARVAEPLGVDLHRAATGIVRVVNVTMAEAIKAISTHRGHDVREFTLVPFGGAGPVHACQIAVDLGIRQVLVPPTPGVFSAQGLMLSTVKHDHVRSRLEPISSLAEADVNERFEAILADADAGLAEDGFAPEDRRLRCLLELRYAGQGYELAVPVEPFPLRPGDLVGYRAAFDELHRREHGHAAPDQPVEVVNYRVEAIGLVPPVTLPDPVAASASVEVALVGRRPVLFPSLGDDPLPVPVYDRTRLAPGHEFSGPAIVEQYDATTVVCPEQDATVDDRGNLVISLREVPHEQAASAADRRTP